MEVDSGLTLTELHDVLRIAFGWRESHLHQFTDHATRSRHDELARIGLAPRTWARDDPFAGNDEDLPEAEWTLGRVFDSLDGPLLYEYDFGDGWTHQIDLVERVESDRSSLPAVLLGGKRRGPLEDSGGVHGYQEKLAILADRNSRSTMRSRSGFGGSPALGRLSIRNNSTLTISTTSWLCGSTSGSACPGCRQTHFRVCRSRPNRFPVPGPACPCCQPMRRSSTWWNGCRCRSGASCAGSSAGPVHSTLQKWKEPGRWPGSS